jgi:hypothetical protein
METKKLQILKDSLKKKEQQFDERLNDHFGSVKQANGQPLNDKRNGRATIDKWEKQNDALRSLRDSIEKTKSAIEIEEGKIHAVESSKEYIPAEILELITGGELLQWRKYPNIFFVNGVNKARIIWDSKRKKVTHKFTNTLTDKEQRKKFAAIYNKLYLLLNN